MCNTCKFEFSVWHSNQEKNLHKSVWTTEFEALHRLHIYEFEALCKHTKFISDKLLKFSYHT